MRALCALMIAVSVAYVSLLSAWGEDEARRKVTVRVTGIASVKGQLLASLFIDSPGFPSDAKKAFQNQFVAIAGKEVSVTFTNVPVGKCAVAICHDENGNDAMDVSLLGRPQEGHGASRNPKTRFGPPRFKDSSFNVSTQDVVVGVVLTYP